MQLVELEVLYPRVIHGLWARSGDQFSHDWLRTFLPVVVPAQSAGGIEGAAEQTR